MNDAQLSLHGFREAVKFFVDLGKTNKTGTEFIYDQKSLQAGRSIRTKSIL